MLVAWNDEYALGYEVIDAGHRMVIDAINRLNDCQGGEVVGNVLDVLDRQLERQFHHEEALMMVSRSARLAEQRSDHQRMRNVLAHLRQSHLAGERVDSVLLLNLVAFLQSHLRGADVEEFGAEPIRWVA